MYDKNCVQVNAPQFIAALKMICRERDGAFTAGFNSVTVHGGVTIVEPEEVYDDLRVEVVCNKGKLTLEVYEENASDDERDFFYDRVRISGVTVDDNGIEVKHSINAESIQHALMICNYVLAGTGVVVRERDGKRYLEVRKSWNVLGEFLLDAQGVDFGSHLCDLLQITEPDFDNYITWEMATEKVLNKFCFRSYWFSGEQDCCGPLSRYCQAHLLRVGKFSDNISSPFMPVKFWYY